MINVGKLIDCTSPAMRSGLRSKRKTPNMLEAVVRMNASMIMVQALNEPVNRVSRYAYRTTPASSPSWSRATIHMLVSSVASVTSYLLLLAFGSDASKQVDEAH